MGFIREAIIGGVSAVLDTSQWNDEGVVTIIETHAQSSGGISHAGTQHKGVRGLHRGTLAPKGDGKGLQSVGGIPTSHRNGAQSAGSIENRRFHCIAFTSLSDIAHIDQIETAHTVFAQMIRIRKIIPYNGLADHRLRCG